MKMVEEDMLRLREMRLAPYIQLATVLIGKPRRGGGNMFRHQVDTMGILVDYGQVRSVLLKAALVHDLVEDAPEFDPDRLLAIDEESAEVYKLVLEVTRRSVETKEDFLVRIYRFGSAEAKILKCADRISNMISLGYVNDADFVGRYADETEKYVFPIAESVDPDMLAELRDLVSSRRLGQARPRKA
jgi:(p)ppGpp synthase/HD superfamily hydrolase